jgi:hypothetical protein
MTTAADRDATLTALKKLAADADLAERSAHSEACRLAEVAGEAQKYAQASMDDARNAFERCCTLSDRSEDAAEAAAAYEEATS